MLPNGSLASFIVDCNKTVTGFHAMAEIVAYYEATSQIKDVTMQSNLRKYLILAYNYAVHYTVYDGGSNDDQKAGMSIIDSRAQQMQAMTDYLNKTLWGYVSQHP